MPKPRSIIIFLFSKNSTKKPVKIELNKDRPFQETRITNQTNLKGPTFPARKYMHLTSMEWNGTLHKKPTYTRIKRKTAHLTKCQVLTEE